MLFDTVFEVFENGSYHIYNIGCISKIYRFKYARSESNFDADFEHPTFQGASSAAAQQDTSQRYKKDDVGISRL